MLTIYKTASEQGLADIPGTQIPELHRDEPPTIGQIITRSHAPFNWRVIHIEAYRLDAELIYLALIHPDHLPTPDRTGWNLTFMRSHSPDLSLDLKLSSEGAWLGGGFAMDGEPPAAGEPVRSYQPRYPDNPDRTEFDPYDRPWQIERIDSYLPTTEQNLVTAIHLCWCQPTLAIAA